MFVHGILFSAFHLSLMDCLQTFGVAISARVLHLFSMRSVKMNSTLFARFVVVHSHMGTEMLIPIYFKTGLDFHIEHQSDYAAFDQKEVPTRDEYDMQSSALHMYI